MHADWSIRALEAGKHVLCEKPFSRRPEDVERAWDLAQRSGLILMEAFMWRHHPQSLRVRELVREGAIGALRLVRTSFSFPLTDTGNIRMRADMDGGALMDVGCYCISGARLLAGEPVRVSAEQRVGETGVDMALTGMLRFENDAVALIDCSFELPVRQRLEAYGADGELVVESPWRIDWGGDVVLVRDGKRERVEVPEADSYRLELENLSDAIEGRAEPLLGRDDALGQARTIAALYRAAAEGRAVEPDQR
jgi:xylose dehydrogenase (NAD/NADP)